MRGFKHIEIELTELRVYIRMMATQLTDLQRYAFLGAQTRLHQLAQEKASIYRTFPQLRPRQGSIETDTIRDSGEPAPRRQRPGMSAAQRRAVGRRMKKYWAARRAAANGTAARKESSPAETPGAMSRGATAKGATAPRRHGAREMSPAMQKRMSDAQKARWAKRKGAAG